MYIIHTFYNQCYYHYNMRTYKLMKVLYMPLWKSLATSILSLLIPCSDTMLATCRSDSTNGMFVSVSSSFFVVIFLNAPISTSISLKLDIRFACTGAYF